MAARHYPPLAERFWEKVEKSDGCWVWTGAQSHFGHGSIQHHRRTLGAHRVSWELHNGPIPEGMCVLHRCDNPPCVRPDHLFLGTQADNSHDRDRKGRQVALRGEKAYQALLTEEQVGEILLQPHERISVLARRYGVTMSAIHRIRIGASWRNAAIRQRIAERQP